MIELAFMTCLLMEPSECQDRQMFFYDVSVMACVLGAQPVLAKWVQQHPGWHVARWKCRAVQSTESDA